MSAEDIEAQLNEMFELDTPEAEMEETSSSSLSDEGSEEVDNGVNASDEWEPQGELPSIPFTNVEHMNVGPAESPFDFFKLLFNATFMSMLVTSINTHALRVLLEVSANASHSSISQWKDIDIAELQVFLGLLFYMGHIQLNGINEYWRSDSLFEMQFSNFMDRDRFLMILRNLTFQDPSLTFSPNDHNRYTQGILNFFNGLMKTLVVPAKNLMINESVDRSKIRHNIHGKRHKYGVKLYVLTDSNGISQKMHLCCDSHDVDVRGHGNANKVVMSLMEDYLNAGHSLYMDNFYTSVTLAEDLLAKKTYVTGTLKANRSRNPTITKVKLCRGSILTRYNPRGVSVTNYKDKKNVIMISTEHKSDIVEYRNRHGKITRKPKVIVEYNNFMKGVDRKDQMLSFCPAYTKSRWYTKILIHTMQLMMLNSFMLFNQKQKETDNVMEFDDFRLNIVQNLLQIKQTTHRPTTRAIKTNQGEQVHLPLELPRNDKGRTMRKDCRHCLETLHIRKAALFYCDLCIKKPGLCLSCFRPYHKY